MGLTRGDGIWSSFETIGYPQNFPDSETTLRNAYQRELGVGRVFVEIWRAQVLCVGGLRGKRGKGLKLLNMIWLILTRHRHYHVVKSISDIWNRLTSMNQICGISRLNIKFMNMWTPSHSLKFLSVPSIFLYYCLYFLYVSLIFRPIAMMLGIPTYFNDVRKPHTWQAMCEVFLTSLKQAGISNIIGIGGNIKGT